MISFSKTENSLTVVLTSINGDNRTFTITSTHPKWEGVLSALRDNNEPKLASLLGDTTYVKNYTKGEFEVQDDMVYWKGRELHGLDVDRLLGLIADNLPVEPMLKFLTRKYENPSKRSIDEMYKFLEHRKMPITPDGKILGYKGVGGNYYSKSGNTATVILTGVVDKGGHVRNQVGDSISCDRSSVCDDHTKGCSDGLHIGSVEYAKNWGDRVMIVEFCPSDIVSVPSDSNFQKLRVCAYYVVGEYTRDMNDVYTEDYVEGSTKAEATKAEATKAEATKAEATKAEASVAAAQAYADRVEAETVKAERDDAAKTEATKAETAIVDPVRKFTAKQQITYKAGYDLGYTAGKNHRRRFWAVDEAGDYYTNSLPFAKLTGYSDGYVMGRRASNKKLSKR